MAQAQAKTYDLEKAARPALLLLGVLAFAEAATGVSYYIDYTYLADLPMDRAFPYDTQPEWTYTLSLAAGLIYLVVYVACLIASGIWIYRAAANAKALAPDEMTHRPGWAVGWYFIPFANLWMPFQIQKIVWRIAKGPTSSNAVPGFLFIWWFTWLFGYVASQISLRLFNASYDTYDFLNVVVLDIIIAIVGLVTIILFRRLIRSVTDGLTRRLGSGGGLAEVFA